MGYIEGMPIRQKMEKISTVQKYKNIEFLNDDSHQRNYVDETTLQPYKILITYDYELGEWTFYIYKLDSEGNGEILVKGYDFYDLTYKMEETYKNCLNFIKGKDWEKINKH